jgi:acyl-coenzyme A synthetase/AMP-(fatty) acid ligase
MGRPVPGHEVAIRDTGGDAAPTESEGEIAVRRPDPAMFLGGIVTSTVFTDHYLPNRESLI